MWSWPFVCAYVKGSPPQPSDLNLPPPCSSLPPLPVFFISLVFPLLRIVFSLFFFPLYSDLSFLFLFLILSLSFLLPCPSYSLSFSIFVFAFFLLFLYYYGALLFHYLCLFRTYFPPFHPLLSPTLPPSSPPPSPTPLHCSCQPSRLSFASGPAS